MTSCICCGEPGEADRGDGYFLVLCPKHTKVRKGGGDRQLKAWFEDADEIPTVFLDFDGVLHPEPCWPENTFCRKELLEEVLREFPQVPIVISSTWRETHSMGDMKAMFSPDIAVRIVGKTPYLRNPRKNDILNCDGEPPPWERQWEIERWMGKNRAMGSPWIAIDDRPRWFKDECPNLLVTSSKIGFSKSDQETLRQMIEKRLP
jgi:hypothetical protein